MIFTLEALQAKHGEALLLHYGQSDEPKLIVIDGGPSGVYQAVLRPRLAEIKEERSPDEPLRIRMLMVSHADQDHLNGLVAMTNEMLDRSDSGREPAYDVYTLWHNSFDDIMQDEGEDLFASLKAAVKPLTAGGSLPANLALSRQAAAPIFTLPRGAYFGNANLSHANLSGSDLTNADLSSAFLRKANLSQTNYTRRHSLSLIYARLISVTPT